MELADGAWIFLAFLIIAFVGVVIGYFTTAGGINTRPYGKIYSGAPGAKGRSEVSGRAPRVRLSAWSRGTKEGSRKEEVGRTKREEGRENPSSLFPHPPAPRPPSPS